MFRVILYSQWKWSRLIGVLRTVAGFAPPVASPQGAALAERFALAVLVAYAVFFAISAGTARTAGIILGAIATLIVVQIVASVANVELDLWGKVVIVVLNWPGPLAVFTGRWMLVDV